MVGLGPYWAAAHDICGVFFWLG
uniref:Uncharacterized protein n=1 Tax=Arundo donax TaxID=35708 RepID=A0A0A9C6C0_ARUDO